MENKEEIPALKTSFEEINSTTYAAGVERGDEKVMDVVVGDEKQEGFYPRVKFKKWDNEVNFSIGIIDADPETGAIIDTKAERIEWCKGDVTARFYHKEVPKDPEGLLDVPHDGAFEFDIVLAQKPNTNIVDLSIQTKGLDFFYQPMMTEEERAGGIHFTPINVECSYAVYHSEKSGDYSELGGNNYRTGKAFHIYRPEIFDANGVRVWGDLSIDQEAGILSVIIPEKFLEDATYPVVVDPTFGYTTIGASVSNFPADYYVMFPYTSPSDAAKADSVVIYVSQSASVVRGVIINNSNVIISNGIGNGVSTAGGMPNWFTSTIPGGAAISPSTTYKLAAISDGAGYRRDAVVGGEYSANSYASPTNPTGILSISQQWSVYVNYSAASAGGIPNRITMVKQAVNRSNRY